MNVRDAVNACPLGKVEVPDDFEAFLFGVHHLCGEQAMNFAHAAYTLGYAMGMLDPTVHPTNPKLEFIEAKEDE
jgi:hypothetical protein